MFAKLMIFLNPIIDYVRQKYTDIQLMDGIKWGLIILLMIYIISKISAVAVGIFATVLIIFIAVKLFQNYILPKIRKE